MDQIRNPFQRGDRVVPNGFKAGDDRYPFRSSYTRLRWARGGTVLTVDGASPTYVMAGTDGTNLAYYPAELRVATAEEAAAAERQTLHCGSIIKHEDDVMFVRNPEPDSDGEIRVTNITSSSSAFFKLSHGYTVLGQIMEDGDYRPAATIHTADED